MYKPPIDHRECKVNADEYPAPKPEGKLPAALTQIEPCKECHQDTHHGEDQDVLKMLTHTAWTPPSTADEASEARAWYSGRGNQNTTICPFLGAKKHLSGLTLGGRKGGLNHFFLPGFSGGFSCTRSRNLAAMPLARKTADSPYL